MSTVLDALRRLQREREAQRKPWELRASASDLVALGRARRRRPWRWLAGLCALVSGLASMAGVLLLLRGELPAGAWVARRATASAPAPLESEPPAEAAKPPLPVEAAKPPLPVDAAKPPLPEAAKPPLPVDAAKPPLSVDAAKPPLPEAAKPPLPEAAKPPLSVDGAVDRTASTPPVASPPLRVGADAAKPPLSANAARSPLSVGAPRPPSADAALASDGRAGRVSAASARWDARLARVRVDRIRWHPEPDRRVAYLHLPDRSELPAREGDVVDGMLILRIDPDAVELEVGSATKRARLGP